MAYSFALKKQEKKYYKLLPKFSRKVKASANSILRGFKFFTHSISNNLISQQDRAVLKILFKAWEHRLNSHIDNILAKTNSSFFATGDNKLVGTLYETCFFDYHKVIEMLKSKNSFNNAINRVMLDTIRITFQKLNISYEQYWYPDYKDLEADKIGYFKNLYHFEDRIQNLEKEEVERIYFKVIDNPCSPLGLSSPEWDTSKLGLKLDVVSNMLSNQNQFLHSLSQDLS